jgi:hypothetical protein
MVVIIGMDYCYTGAAAVLGNGTAKFIAGSFIKAINRDGTLIVDMPEIERRCEGDNRGESDKTVAMIGGSVLLAQLAAKDAMVTAITESATQSAKASVDAIANAMKD